MNPKVICKLGMAMFAFAAPLDAFAQAPQYSSKDIIDTFAKKPAPQTQGAGVCEARGMVTDEDGVCEPAKDARGFSLPTRANLHAAQPAAAAPYVRQATRAPRVTRSAAPAELQTKRDLLITFKTGSSDLTDQAKANAKVFAEALDSPALAGSKFEIAGYTDASGAADKNLTLSEARAASVKSFLVAQGVSDVRLDTHGYGATDFAMPSQPLSARNRRVEAKRLN